MHVGNRLGANLILPHLASPLRLRLTEIGDKITKWCQCSLCGQNHSMHWAGFPDEGTAQLSLERSVGMNHHASPCVQLGAHGDSDISATCFKVPR